MTYIYPVFLKPYFQNNIWGGRKLETEFGFDIPEGNVGECWSVSGYPDRESVVCGGTFDGMKLSELWEKEPMFFGELPGEYRSAGYPFITKIIDAKGNLSIQVHPDDAYASVNENGARGKTECWYILDCPENGELILGHNAGSREEFSRMIAEDRWDDLLRRVPVKKGDFIQLEPGTIHAITVGVLLLENQQSSDITYRLYDYGRLENGKPRQLHIKQSTDVTVIPAADPEQLVLHTEGQKPNELHELVSCKFYKVIHMPVEGGFTLSQKEPFIIATVVAGTGKMTVGGTAYDLGKGESFILPADYGTAAFEGSLDIVLCAPVL